MLAIGIGLKTMPACQFTKVSWRVAVLAAVGATCTRSKSSTRMPPLMYHCSDSFTVSRT